MKLRGALLAHRELLFSYRSYSSYSKRLNDSQGLIESSDVFIFDCDGVIWRGDSLIPGADKAIEYLRSCNKSIYFVTNNSTKSRHALLSKFSQLGIATQPSEILSSSFAAAIYLLKQGFDTNGKKVYVIGESGICDELKMHHIEYVGGPEHANKVANLHDDIVVDDNIGAVVVGLDRNINYYKIQYAQLCLNKLHALFIATNRDRVAHLTPHSLWAGGGSMVGALVGCQENHSSKNEPILVGKPAPLLINYIKEQGGVNDPSRIVMIGDRLDTDMEFGNCNGMRTVLTLSGVTTLEQLIALDANDDKDVMPSYYVDSIADFVPRNSRK